MIKVCRLFVVQVRDFLCASLFLPHNERYNKSSLLNTECYYWKKSITKPSSFKTLHLVIYIYMYLIFQCSRRPCPLADQSKMRNFCCIYQHTVNANLLQIGLVVWDEKSKIWQLTTTNTLWWQNPIWPWSRWTIKTWNKEIIIYRSSSIIIN